MSLSTEQELSTKAFRGILQGSFADKIACEKIIHPHLCDGTPSPPANHASELRSPNDFTESIAVLRDVISWDRVVQKMVQSPVQKIILRIPATVPLQFLRTIPMDRILPKTPLNE